MARPCREYGCPNLVTEPNQKGFCDAHAAGRSNWNKRPARSGSTTERGYGWDWQKLRLSILQRDKFRCQSCFKSGLYVVAKHVDHIIAKAKGGTDEPSNLQALCVACHETKTAKENNSQ